MAHPRRIVRGLRVALLAPALTPLAALVAVLLAAGCASNGGAGASVPTRPNLVLILVDDAGWADFGFQTPPGEAGSFAGLEGSPTPALDALAAQGLRMTQGYVAASVCSPSRAALLTGRYPQRFGHEFNIPGKPQPGTTWDETGLPTDERTLADALRACGYRTAAIGKWHLGETPRYRPQQRGFDEFFGFLGGSRSYFALPAEGTRRGHVLREGDTPVEEVEGSYLTDVLVERSMQFVETSGERPFFLYLSLNAVHTPMHAPDEALEEAADVRPEGRAKLAAMTRAMDRAVGRLVECIDALGRGEDTLVVVLNDNGGATINHSSNEPLRGHKGSKFEGGLRVPFLARWTGVLEAGGTFDRPVSALDVFPTFLAAAGGELEGAELDGTDLLPHWTGGLSGDPHERLFWRRGVTASVREGDWKLIRVEGHAPLLFDLAADPEERVDRALEHPARVAALLAALDAWETGTREPRWRTAPVWSQRQIEWHTAPDERAAPAEDG